MDSTLNNFLGSLGNYAAGNGGAASADQGYGSSNYAGDPTLTNTPASNYPGQVVTSSPTTLGSIFAGMSTTQWVVLGAVTAAVIIIALY